MTFIKIWAVFLLLLQPVFSPAIRSDLQAVNAVQNVNDLPALRPYTILMGTTQPTPLPTTTATATISAPDWIVPIQRSTPDGQGRIFHIVSQGQSLWSIAIAYGTKINSILLLNNLPLDTKTLYNGERLLIPTSLTPLPAAAPTVLSTPGAAPALEETPVPQLATPVILPGTQAPSPTPTVDAADQAAYDERFRSGLFIALVISVVLIAAGLFLNRR